VNIYLTITKKKNLLKIPIEERNGKIIPKKLKEMKQIPQYDRFIHERFERCLDLYLCPRKQRTRNVINPLHLLPKLPDINDLKPFPELLTMEYKGHASCVRCISISPCGLWLASGSDDGTVRVWEIDSGREYWRHSFGKNCSIKDVSFNPLNYRPLLCVAVDHRCILIHLDFISNDFDVQNHIVSFIEFNKKNPKKNSSCFNFATNIAII